MTTTPRPAPTCDAEADGERLATDDVWGSDGRGDGHIARYLIAAGLCAQQPCRGVLDAACGTGYGAAILAPPNSEVSYVGVDRRAPDAGWPADLATGDGTVRRFRAADLCDPAWTDALPVPPDRFDVAVSFETIEHLTDPEPLLRALLQARRYVVVSVPVVPTVEHNPWHVRDYQPGEIAAIMLAMDPNWAHVQTFQQPSELAEVVILGRRCSSRWLDR